MLGGYLLSLRISLFGFREILTTAGIVAGIIEVATFAVTAHNDFVHSQRVNLLRRRLETEWWIDFANMYRPVGGRSRILPRRSWCCWAFRWRQVDLTQ